MQLRFYAVPSTIPKGTTALRGTTAVRGTMAVRETAAVRGPVASEQRERLVGGKIKPLKG